MMKRKIKIIDNVIEEEKNLNIKLSTKEEESERIQRKNEGKSKVEEA